MKMTPTQQAAFTRALIEEAGGDTSKVATSYSTADKSRRSVVEDIATTSKEIWNPPKLASLHWDSKLMPSISTPNEKEERLSVLVGNADDVKLLGVPGYKPGTDRKSGDIISELSLDLLRSWKCYDNITNMVFNTTASSTGHLTAACIAIQNSLGKLSCGLGVDIMWER